ncbi:hypothetical protein BBI01_01210 [Chryseobacterium artocarpi]|uniref:N-acetyltransferase domain-containing protein n=1 Tax=Chryseobacterium artocarpi TaxID=1414727 RepID=A0A1B8ZZV9_9FLAO|nr:GNAT family N-acetyltransferase [Chryseobacterium artocarpi]OCA77110.1 hypothetical protein BBI01_01210 [Chryseobacterium artocarpi]
MDRHQLKINFKPSQKDLNEIFTWTTFPRNNWSEIEKCYNNNCVVVAYYKEKPIGFIAYKYASVCIYVSIAETLPEFKGKGVCKFIVSKIIERYRESIFKALYLRCAPAESQFAWEKMGFTYYPKRARENRNELYMFLVFGDVCQVQLLNENQSLPANVIEIWDRELPHEDIKAKWYVEFDVWDGTNSLIKPFIFFGNDKWQIKVNGEYYRYKDYNRKSSVHECFYIDTIR